jgi:hypothetical protein
MGRCPSFLLIALLLLLGAYCAAQSKFEVSEPRFELMDNHVLISFDILNSTPSENFNITLEITDAEGKTIRAKALAGDIGQNVPGGNNKLVTWNLEADHIVMDAEIVVNIRAEIIKPPPAVPVVSEAGGHDSKEYNRTGLILQSLALPGLGLTRVTGKPHWIRGVAGYGCLAGSVVLNKMAVSAYSDFLDAETTEDSEAFFSKSTNQDQFSELLAYAAIGIWVTDLVWTMLGTRELNRYSLNSGAKGITFITGIDPISSAPMVGFNFKF